MKKIVLFFVLSCLLSCKKTNNAIFHISNNSEDLKEVPLYLLVDKDTVFNRIAKFSDIKPDLQYSQSLQLEKGNHKILFGVLNTELKREEIINFDKDKWIFLCYYFKKPADSLKKKRLDEIFGNIPKSDSTISFLYEGRRPSLSFYIMENQPVHH